MNTFEVTIKLPIVRLIDDDKTQTKEKAKSTLHSMDKWCSLNTTNYEFEFDRQADISIGTFQRIFAVIFTFESELDALAFRLMFSEYL